MKMGEELLVRLLRHIANTVAMTKEYKWSDGFSRKESVEALELVQKELRDLDFSNMPLDDLKVLGFTKWSEDKPLYLVPLYFYPALPDGTELVSISGDRAIKGTDDIDLDTRFGCIAWGIEVEEGE